MRLKAMSMIKPTTLEFIYVYKKINKKNKALKTAKMATKFENI